MPDAAVAFLGALAVFMVCFIWSLRLLVPVVRDYTLIIIVFLMMSLLYGGIITWFFATR